MSHLTNDMKLMTSPPKIYNKLVRLFIYKLRPNALFRRRFNHTYSDIFNQTLSIVIEEFSKIFPKLIHSILDMFFPAIPFTNEISTS